jgi:hypothetical protein
MFSYPRKPMNIPMPTLTKQDNDRFWANITKGSDENACWLWLNGSRGDYGSLTIRIAPSKRTTFKAHRIAYFIATGIDPLEKDVCHICDNPPCCNPNHLFLGTRSDNIRDMVHKGRRSYVGISAENNLLSKLLASDVKEIRRLYAEGGWSHKRLGQKYGVSAQSILDIVRRDTWKSVE